MKRPLLLLLLTSSTACRSMPDKQDDSGDPSSDETAVADESGEGEGEGEGEGVGEGEGEGEGVGEGEGEGDRGNPDASIEIPGGTWTTRESALVRDTCSWMESGLDSLGLSLEAFLPREFVVQPTFDGFQIEAQYFGAAAPIDCMVQGFDFTCETQTVVPEAYGLGSLGWSYSIVYEGRVPDLNTNDNIEGVARVTYSGVDADTAAALASVGMRAEDCFQDVYLMVGYRY